MSLALTPRLTPGALFGVRASFLMLRVAGRLRQTLVRVLLLSLVFALSAPAQQTLWSTYFEAGLAALDAGDLPAAEANLTAARKAAVDPEAAGRSIVALGRLRLAQQAPEQAEQVLVEGLSGASGELQPALLRTLAESLRRQGRFGEAEERLLAALEADEALWIPRDPARAPTLWGLGELYLAQGRYAEAEPVLTEALTLEEQSGDHPSLANGLNALASAHLARGSYRTAAALLDRARSLLKESGESARPAIVNQGRLARLEGRYADAEALFRGASKLSQTDAEKAAALDELAATLQARADYPAAEEMFREGLELRRRAFGEVSLEAARSQAGLAGLLSAQGRLDEAGRLYQESLDLAEAFLGGEHPEVAAIQEEVGRFEQARGNLETAEKRLEQSAAMRRKLLGEQHPDYAGSLLSLAKLAQRQRRFAEAEKLFEQCITIREKAFGPTSGAMAEALGGLAALLHQQGRYAEAQPYYERALKALEGSFGRDHPETLQLTAGLAALRVDQGDDAAAVSLLEDLLPRQQAHLGAQAAPTMATRRRLGALRLRQGEHEAAESLLRESVEWMRAQQTPATELAAAEALLGESLLEQPEKRAEARTILSGAVANGDASVRTLLLLARAERLLENTPAARELYSRVLGAAELSAVERSDALFALGSLEQDAARPREAEPHLVEALRLRQTAPLDRRRVEIRQALGNLYADLGRYTQAEAAFSTALEEARDLGTPSRDLEPDLMLGLAGSLANQSRLDEAETLFRNAVDLASERYGDEDLRRVPSLDGAGRFYRDQGRLLESEQLLEQAVRILEAAGENHPDLPLARNNLATVYRLRGNYSAAQKLYRASLAVLERRLGPDDPEVAAALSNLAETALEAGEFMRGQELLERAVGILDAAGDAGLERLPATLDQLAKAYFAAKKYSPAEAALERSLAVGRKRLGPGHPSAARTLSYLATVKTTQGKLADAQRFYEQAMETIEGAYGKEPVVLAPVLEDYAALLRLRKRDAEAAVALDRAERIRRQARER